MRQTLSFRLIILTTLLTIVLTYKVTPQDAVFVDIATEAGIAENTTSYHVVVGDYNSDGLDDFIFNRRWSQPFRVYRNTGGAFVNDEIRAANFGTNDRLDCKWGDVNQDGKPDLYCSRGAGYGTKIKANELWIQQADGLFRQESKAYKVADSCGRGRQVEWLNFNGDKYPDLFVGNDFPRKDTLQSYNRLFINQNGRSFRELKFTPGFSSEIGTYASFAADIDNDGYDDLLLCGKDCLHIYRSDKGTGLVDMAPGLKLNSKFRDAFAADLSGDGRPDLVLVSDEVKIYINKGNWTFWEPQIISAQDGYSAVAADMDGDKDRDIYVSTRASGENPNPKDMVLLNIGNGQFKSMLVPVSTNEGLGGRCAAIDHDNDGRFSILVTNSGDQAKDPAGPLQLITLEFR